jgi:hypothetical protein
MQQPPDGPERDQDSPAARTRDTRLAVAVAFGCAGIGAAVVLGVLAVILARNGGQLPRIPRLVFAISRIPDSPGDVIYAEDVDL